MNMREDLRAQIYAFRQSQCLYAAASLNIAEHLKRTPSTSVDLALLTDTHTQSLHRLLLALSEIGILREKNQLFHLTEMGELMLPDVEGSLKLETLHVLSPQSQQPWMHLLSSIRSGKPAFQEVFQTDAWSYREEHSETNSLFNNWASTMSMRESAAILKHLDLKTATRIIDVGGGKGALLAEILRHHPHVMGILLDRPTVTAEATVVLQEVLDRCEIVAGDFFDALPSGCDVYILKAVIHNWNDEAAITILKNCRTAMPPGSRLILIESLPLQGRDPRTI